jgi:hypothetical protein
MDDGAASAAVAEPGAAPSGLHHVELWVPDLAGALPAWRWLLETMGWAPFQDWEDGRSRRLGDVYVVMEQRRRVAQPRGAMTQPRAHRRPA